MTSQTFLHKSTFGRAVKKGLPLALLNFLIITSLFPLDALHQFRSIAYNTDKAQTNLADMWYLILSSNCDRIAEYLPLFAAAAGVVFGIVMFLFINSKRIMNIYYSVGVRRTTLFRTVYLAGALLMFLSAALPIVADIVINVHFLGSNKVIWGNAVYILITLSGMNFLGYSVAALCTAGTGTISEGAFNSVMFLSLPFALPASLSLLSRRFLNGSAFGMPISPIESELSGFLDAPYGAIHLIPEKFNPFQMCTLSLTSNYTNASKQVKNAKFLSIFDAPGSVFALVFITVLVVLFAFIAIRLFARRKAEYCGMPNANKGMNIAAVTILGFYICCVLATALPVNSLLSVILSFLIFTVLFIGISMIIERSFKEGLKNIKAVVIPLTVVSAVLVIFTSGGFGYSSYVPEASEVKSARVTAVKGDLYEGTRMIVRDHLTSGTYPLEREMSFNEAAEITFLEADEVPGLISLHKKLIENKGYQRKHLPKSVWNSYASRDIAVSYTLKNGKTVTRYFINVTDDKTMEEAILLQHNKTYKDELKKSVSHTFDCIINPEKYEDSSEGPLAINRIGVASKFKNYGEELILKDEQFEELLDAVLKDIDGQTAQEHFFPASPALGYLYTSYDEPETVDVMQEEQVEAVIVSGGLVGRDDFVTITPDMERTISLLTKWGYDKVFTREYKPVEITAINERELKLRENYIPVLESNKLTGSEGIHDGHKIFEGNLIAGANQVTITDEKEIEAIIKASHLFYPTTGNGYMISITEAKRDGDEGNRIYTAYVPENQAPDFLKNALGGTK